MFCGLLFGLWMLFLCWAAPVLFAAGGLAAVSGVVLALMLGYATYVFFTGAFGGWQENEEDAPDFDLDD